MRVRVRVRGAHSADGAALPAAPLLRPRFLKRQKRRLTLTLFSRTKASRSPRAPPSGLEGAPQAAPQAAPHAAPRAAVLPVRSETPASVFQNIKSLRFVELSEFSWNDSMATG